MVNLISSFHPISYSNLKPLILQQRVANVLNSVVIYVSVQYLHTEIEMHIYIYKSTFRRQF